MAAVATELQYVPLSNPYMFKELPCRVSCPIRSHGAKIDRNPRDRIVKV